MFIFSFHYKALLLYRALYYWQNNCPKIEPCSTTAWIVSQVDIWPLSKSLWNLPLKKLVINWNKFPLISFHFNLNNNPSCQTLLNASDMSSSKLRLSRLYVIMKAFNNSHCGYSADIWMMYSKSINNKRNIIHEKKLRIVYNSEKFTFSE